MTRILRTRVAWLGAIFGPLVLAVALAPSRTSIASTAAALAFVPLIVIVAVVGSRPKGVVASISSAVWFDFFLVVPYDRLTISHRTDLETTIALLVVGVVVTELAAQSRNHNQLANTESRYLSMTHELAVLAARGVPEGRLTSRASAMISEVLTLKACRFQQWNGERCLPQIDCDGDVLHAGMLWPVHVLGIPGPKAEIAAQSQGRVMGHFILTPTPGQPVGREERLVAYTLAEIVGAALPWDRAPA